LENINPEIIKALTEHANKIVAGSYEDVDKILSLTDKTENSPELAELAETFGMMSVKIEAREYALEQTIEELKKKNAHIAALNNVRVQLSSLFVSIVLLVSSYTFALGVIASEFVLKQHFFKIFTRYPIVEIISIFIILRMMFVSKLSLKDFGVTLTGWKRSIVESLIVSAVFIGLLAYFKHWVCAHHSGVFKENHIFSLSYFNISYVTYILIAPLQEFVARGVVQGSLERLLDTRYKGFVAILVTSFLFGALHMAHSLNLAIASFISSWVWGWMYCRQKNLTGVSLSHFLVGNAADLMGYWTFF